MLERGLEQGFINLSPRCRENGRNRIHEARPEVGLFRSVRAFVVPIWYAVGPEFALEVENHAVTAVTHDPLGLLSRTAKYNVALVYGIDLAVDNLCAVGVGDVFEFEIVDG